MTECDDAASRGGVSFVFAFFSAAGRAELAESDDPLLKTSPPRSS